MLLQLSIRNYALIEEIVLDFTGGLNVLTGETGAGKSILIDALHLVLGERGGAEILRVKDKACVIEAAFSTEAVSSYPEEISSLIEAGDETVMLRREISPDGRSRCFINRKAVNLSSLRDLGARLVDFHGQHDQQHIFRADTHRELLDRLAGLTSKEGPAPSVKEYRKLFSEYTGFVRQRDEILKAVEGRQRQMDLLKYQIDEIERINPAENEEENLESEKIRLSHAQKLTDLTGEILEALDSSDTSASAQIADSYRSFQSWAKIDPEAEALKSALEDVQMNLEELNRRVRDYQESLSFDEDRLGELETRLDGIEMLKRKYGGSVSQVREFLLRSKAEYDQLLNAEVYQKDAERGISKIKPALEKAAAEISALRKKAAKKLQGEAERELKDLGMPHARFECVLQETPPAEHGSEAAEFFFTPNPGQDLKPLIKVASGGEASRVLLALKRALAKVDDTPTLIFDEIDSNIGGRLGDTVGRKLREISSERQVLLITHLPQIASFAERHFKVIKSVSKGETRVRYDLLEGDAKVRELAEMMNGFKESDIARSHAKEMLKSASN